MPGRPIDLAIGHSLGGVALALAASRLEPVCSVYLDPVWRMDAEQHDELSALWHRQRTWSREQFAEAYSTWAEGDLDSRMHSLESMDARCIDGLAPGGGHELRPDAPTGRDLIVPADSSPFVGPEDQVRLATAGFSVQPLPGVGHASFREDPHALMALLDRFRNGTKAP